MHQPNLNCIIFAQTQFELQILNHQHSIDLQYLKCKDSQYSEPQRFCLKSDSQKQRKKKNLKLKIHFFIFVTGGVQIQGDFPWC